MDIYKFDDEELAYAYECAPRFDEGEIRQSDEYSDICRRKIDIYEFIIAKYQMYGDEIEHLLWEFEDTFSDEMELEAMHFFAEGYTAGIEAVGGNINRPIIRRRLKKLRKERGMDPEDLADLLNIRSDTYEKFETGEREYTIAALVKLAKFYGVSCDYLLGISDDK